LGTLPLLDNCSSLPHDVIWGATSSSRYGEGVTKIDGESASIARIYGAVRSLATELLRDVRLKLRRLIVTLLPGPYYARYKASLAAQLARLEVPGNGGALDLEDVYLPLHLAQRGRSGARGEAGGPALTTIEDALLQSPRIAVLGGPGSGKTTLLRHLGLMVARDKLAPEHVRKLTFTHQDEAMDDLVPLLVSLPDLAQSEADIFTYLTETFAGHGFPDADRFLRDRLNDGQCLLLLDGLDRVADGDQRRRLLDQVDALATRSGRRNQIVVSSRPLDRDRPLEGFAHLELAPLDDEDVRRFVRRWFADQSSRADDMLALLERSPRARSMATNPLLLSVLTVAREREERRRVRGVVLYQTCVEILLGEERDDALERSVQRLAYHVHRHRRSRFSTEELSAVSDGRYEAGELLTALLERTKLLRRASEDAYAFLHPLLREYLAAKEIHEGQGVSAVVERVDDPWWREVIVMLAGLQREASDLVEAILARGEQQDEALLLAARCLHDADRTDGGLRPRVRAGLFEIFERDEPALWSRAAVAIAGLEGQTTERAFSDLLRSDDPPLRKGAASALGRICEDWSVAPLVAALGDPAAEVRGRAAWALGRLGDGRAVYPLLKLLGDDSADVRREAIQALGAIGEPALSPLMGALGDAADRVPGRAAEALGRVGVPAIQPLIDALASQRREVREGAVVALAEIGAPAVDPLIEALQRQRPAVRRGAVAALGRIGDPDAIWCIIEALDDEEPMVREQVVTTLVEMGAPAVLPLVESLTDKRRVVSEGAEEALVKIGERAIDGLLQSLGDERRALRWAVVRVLAAIGARHPDVVVRLGEVLSDERETVRQSAVKTLARIGSDPAIEALVGVLQTESDAVRREAMDGLLGLSSDRVVRKLRQALEEGASPGRIIDLVGRIETRSARDFLRELLESEDRAIRQRAALALETDEGSGLYYYRAWERRIEEYLYEHGIFTTGMLGDTPSNLRAVLLQRYVNSHPETDLIFEAETGILRLNAFSSARKIIEYWNRASHNLGDEVELSGQMFGECVTGLTDELCDMLDVRVTGAESAGRLYAFALDVSSVVERTNLPEGVPLVFLRRETLEERDLDSLRSLLPKMKIFHRTALLVLFSQGEQLSQARRLLDDRLCDIHAFDVILLGRRDIQRIVTAKDAQRALRFTICAQADLTLLSPYSFDEPASRMLFFGREFEIRTMTQAIDNSSVAVLGGRRIGKTSILHRVAGLLEESRACYYLDCHPIRNYDVLFRTLAYRWPSVGRLAPEPVSFHSVVAELRDDGPLILVLDEIDALLRFDIQHDELLFKTFRSLSQEGQCRFIFSGERVLSNQLKYGSKSPLFNFCGQRIPLGYLEPKSATRLIVEPMGWMNIDLRDRERIVAGILSLSSCHPRLVQYICHSLIKQINREGVRYITEEHLQRIAGSNELQDEYLHTVWGDATPFERALTLALEETSFTQDDIRAALDRWDIPYTWGKLKAALHNLEICSILERDDGTFRFVPEHFPRIARESLDLEMEINSWRRRIASE
jgi:HEAT repeat protein